MSDVRYVCIACDGTGVVPHAPPGIAETCTICDGTGWLLGTVNSSELQNFLTDILNKVNDIKEKCDEIFEKVK